MGQQHSAVYKYVSRSIDRRLAAMNISKLSIPSRELHSMRHRSYEIIVEYLRVSRNRHQLRLLQNGHVNENSFTAEEIRSIERILDTVMARCEQEHRHQGSDMRRQSLTQHNQVRFGAAQQTYEENLTYGRTRAVSTPNLSSTPRLRTEDENDLSELSSWAVVTKLASSEADKYSECIICLVPFKTADRVLTLPCFHLFHLDCVLTWLKKHLVCPICQLDPREAPEVRSSIAKPKQLSAHR